MRAVPSEGPTAQPGTRGHLAVLGKYYLLGTGTATTASGDEARGSTGETSQAASPVSLAGLQDGSVGGRLP